MKAVFLETCRKGLAILFVCVLAVCIAGDSYAAEGTDAKAAEGKPYAYLFPATLSDLTEHLQNRDIEVHELREEIDLEVTIFTGVTHQIRCQLALGGWPIVNDTLYGARPVAGCARHLLHALAARFTHPVSGEPCCIEAPPKEDLGIRI